MRKRDRGTVGETWRRERTRSWPRGREERTREWSKIVQLSASERKRVGAMLNGHVERACVLGSPVCLSLSLCLPPFSTIRPPCLSANVILRLSLSSLLRLSLSYSRSNRGASIPRPGVPCAPHRFQEGSLRSQPTRGDKLIPRCSDGNVTWRARRQRGFPPTRRRRKGGKRRKSTDERRGASQIVDDVTGNDDDDDNDDDGKGVMEAESRYGN